MITILIPLVFLLTVGPAEITTVKNLCSDLLG